MRLQQFLSQSGIWSRRAAEKHIAAGNVRINGTVTQAQGVHVNPETDTIEYKLPNSRDWIAAGLPSQTYVYALNKPAGYVSTVEDPHAEKTVLQLVPKNPHVVPVGRLDKETTGLLLLSNDGNLVHELTHPSRNVSKTYRIICSFPPQYNIEALEANLQKLRDGVVLDDTRTAKAELTVINHDKEKGLLELEMTIHEGKNRQIRRMMQKIGLNVVQLTRIQIGSLTLNELNLNEGSCVRLTFDQIKKLTHHV